MGSQGKAKEGDASKGPAKPVVLAVGAAALSLLFVIHIMLGLPIGVPGEWWIEYRTRLPGIGAVAFLIVCAVCLIGGAALLDRFPHRSMKAHAGAIAAVFLLYAVFLFAAVRCGPEGAFEMVAPAFKWDAAGLFRQEAAPIENAREYLSGFPRRLGEYGRPERYHETVRVNNNPPGTTMVFYSARRIAQRWAGLGLLASEAVFGLGFEPPDEEFAGTVLACWMLFFGASLSLVPAILLVRRLGSGSPLLSAVVGLMAASMVMFLPGKDTLQVFFFLWMAYFFARAREGRAWAWGAAMGACAAAAFFFTLAAAVVVLVLFLAALWLDFVEGGTSRRREAVFWASAAGGLAGGFMLLWVALGYNSLASLFACYRNHALFYEHFPRTYWKWLLVNPWEFAMFLGGPLVAMVMAASWRGGRISVEGCSSCRAVLMAAVAVLVLLNISGKNASEVARLWVFFMPLLTLPAAALVSRRDGGVTTLVIIAAMQAAYVTLMCIYLDVWRIEALMQEIAPMGGAPFPR